MQDFDELLHLAEQGDHRNIDMLVCDIYGTCGATHGLPADLIASSFGKATRPRDNNGNYYCSFALTVGLTVIFIINRALPVCVCWNVAEFSSVLDSNAH